MKTLMKSAVLFIAALVLTGCAAIGSPPLLERSLEVNKLIEGGTILPDHAYYYAGPEAKPDVIIAIDKKFTFQKSVHWHEVTPTEELLRSWNRMIDNYYRIKNRYYGAWIMTPDGRKAGIWYSMHTNTVIQFPASDQIIIYRPDSVTERRHQLRESRHR
jgi:hypothetical protein